MNQNDNTTDYYVRPCICLYPRTLYNYMAYVAIYYFISTKGFLSYFFHLVVIFSHNFYLGNSLFLFYFWRWILLDIVFLVTVFPFQQYIIALSSGKKSFCGKLVDNLIEALYVWQIALIWLFPRFFHCSLI